MGPGSSMIASRIRSQSFRSSRSLSRLPSVIIAARDTSMNAAGRALRARSSPAFAGALRSPSGPAMSSKTTGIPADAARAAMPLPMVPAPTTPSLAMRMCNDEGCGWNVQVKIARFRADPRWPLVAGQLLFIADNAERCGYHVTATASRQLRAPFQTDRPAAPPARGLASAVRGDRSTA